MRRLIEIVSTVTVVVFGVVCLAMGLHLKYKRKGMPLVINVGSVGPHGHAKNDCRFCVTACTHGEESIYGDCSLQPHPLENRVYGELS